MYIYFVYVYCDFLLLITKEKNFGHPTFLGLAKLLKAQTDENISENVHDTRKTCWTSYPANLIIAIHSTMAFRKLT